MNKRRHPRMNGDNLVVSVSDGKGFFSGYAGDISRFGMLLTDIPLKLDHRVETLSLVISENDKTFKIMAIPRWEVEGKFSKKMGVELVNVPYTWAGFIRKFEPKLKGLNASTTH